MKRIPLQPILQDETALLQPLKDADYGKLFKVAADPEIWSQHPEKNRWQEPVFRKFFDDALASGGAFLIIDKVSSAIAGSSRFYDYNASDDSIFIGYTFYATKFWGSGFNRAVKKLMLDYIFNYVQIVKFNAGIENFRSRKAMEKLGGELFTEVTPDELEAENKKVEYRISREKWLSKQSI